MMTRHILARWDDNKRDLRELGLQQEAS